MAVGVDGRRRANAGRLRLASIRVEAMRPAEPYPDASDMLPDDPEAAFTSGSVPLRL